MNRFLIYVPAAAILTAMGRFQETVVYRDGRLQTHHALYGQTAGIVVCTALALVFLAVVARERRVAREPIFRLGGQRFWPWVFALPLLWEQSSTLHHGDYANYTEIYFGLGGPFRLIYFMAAACAFIACEAWLKAREGAAEASMPTPESVSSRAVTPVAPAPGAADL